MGRRGRKPLHGKTTEVMAPTQRSMRKRKMDEIEEEEKEEEKEEVTKGEKLLMRPWLVSQVGKIPGLSWKEEDLLEIPWRHGSSKTWEDKDVALFQAWAEHSGKSSYLKSKRGDFKANRLKANFRCAINSQIDIKEEKTLRVSKGPGACKVYRFHDQKPRRSEMKRRRTESSDLDNCHRTPRSSISRCSTSSSEDLGPLDIHHEEVVMSEGLDHSYHSALKVDPSRIPTTVLQMDDDAAMEIVEKKTYCEDSGDDSAFSEMSDISDDAVPDWINRGENEILDFFDEGALFLNGGGLSAADELTGDEETCVLTELIPVPKTNMSIAILL